MVTEGRNGSDGDEELLKKIEELEKQNAELAARNVTLQSEVTSLRINSEALTAEIERLRQQLAETDAARPALTLNQLSGQIREALSSIEDGGDGATRYVAKSAEFEFKGAFDSENDELVLRLPGLTQRVDPGLLGTMRFELTGGDTGEVDLSDLVLVPTVLGMNESGATNRLAAAGLALGTVGERESVRSPGTIIAQDPDGGSYVPPETAVDIVMASTSVTVPDLVGRDLDSASSELERRGLVLGDVTAREADETAGTIIAQNPKAGTTVDRGTAVAVTVAEEKKVTVPDVRRATLDEATARLAAIGLKVGQVTQQPSEAARGTVLSQKPKAGSELPPGGSVALVIAGPIIRRARPVPDVVGVERPQAVETIAAAGFTARVEAAVGRRGAAVAFDTVLSQEPAAGTPSAEPDVTIRVAAAADPVTAVRGIGPRAAAALRGAKITSVGALAFAGPGAVAGALGIAEDKAVRFIAAATDLNDAASLEAIEGVDRASAIALVTGGDLRRPDDLAAQDPAELARKLQGARRAGHIESGFTLDRPTVGVWVEAARRHVSG